MKISEKINLDKEGLIEHGPITIVAFGDSVTHGAFQLGEIDYEAVYWNLLRKKINKKRAYVPVNVINAGIGGATAKMSVDRMDAQVLAHNPDLVIVCFGLNDVNTDFDTFMDSLSAIFQKCNNAGVDTIYMTPNMLNTYVVEGVFDEKFRAMAVRNADRQNSGRMDMYMNAAKELAYTMNIPVCDCYAKWKELSKTEDTTMLLSNYINHPTKEMHNLFADCLMEMIFPEDVELKENSSTMAD